MTARVLELDPAGGIRAFRSMLRDYVSIIDQHVKGWNIGSSSIEAI
jgi:hypothetical protein